MNSNKQEIKSLLKSFKTFGKFNLIIAVFNDVHTRDNIIKKNLSNALTLDIELIIFDFEKITPPFILGTAAVVLALGVTYWLISKQT